MDQLSCNFGKLNSHYSCHADPFHFIWEFWCPFSQRGLWSTVQGAVYGSQSYGSNPITGIRIESAADLCGRCLDDVATDVLYMTGNDHALEAADPLELAEIKRRWEPYINQLPEYAYICDDLLSGRQ